jgi:hypothetical protein
MRHGFDWNDEDNQGDSVLKPQQAIAVFLNGDGAIVLRQEGMPYPDEDDIVIIQAVNARAVAEAILARAAESLGITAQPVQIVQARTQLPQKRSPEIELQLSEAAK